MNKFKERILIFISVFMPILLTANDLWSVRMAESVMQRRSGYYGNWDYVTATVLRGFEEAWQSTGDARYYNYIKSTVDHVVNEDGTIDGYNVSEYNIDEINEGRMVLFLYKETGEEKYKTAADLVRSQLNGHPRNSDGGFWHKQVYPWQMWLDGLYMGSPFYADYSQVFDDSEGMDDVALQLLLMEKHARDPETGLLYHGYDESRDQTWSDPVTGQSLSFWGRAIGWYEMALVDVLDFLPQNHTKRDSIIDIVNRLADAMINFQDESGLWWQVVDQGNREGNYLEASVSIMTVYFLAKAMRMGYLDDSYMPNVLQAYDGILNEFVTVNQDSTINIIKTCRTAGLGNGRDGSYDYYVYETDISLNDGKSVGPFITASVEIERMSLPKNFTATTLSESSVQLSWQNTQGTFEGHQILRSSGNGFSEIARIGISDSVYTDDGLDSLTIYQYRLRPYLGDDYGVYSEIVEASTLAGNGRPAYPLNPVPAEGAVDQELDIKLSWVSGTAATSHDIYFGSGNPPSFVTNQSESVFDPGALNEQTTYYWRIDEVNDQGKTTGPVWNFSTRNAPLPKGLIAHWPVAAGSGTTITETENSFDGTLVNTSAEVWQTSTERTFLTFDGVDDYAVITHSDALNFAAGSFSVSFWIKQTVQDRNMRYLIKGTHFETQGTGKRYEVFHHQNNEVRFAIDDNVIKSSLIVDNSSFVTGNWVHVVAVRDVQNDILKLYADNVLVGTLADNTGDISQHEDLYFGLSPDETNNNLDGSMDDIRFYNYAIDDSLIADLYGAGATTIDQEIDILLPENIALNIYPNPFNNITRIAYNIPSRQHVKITLFSLTGQQVMSLLDADTGPGNYSVILDANRLSSGIFFVKIESGLQSIAKKAILIK